MLDLNFMNKDEIKDRTLDSILVLKEANTLKEVEFVIRTVNTKLHDLKD